MALSSHAKYFGAPLVIMRYGEVWTGFEMKLQSQEAIAKIVKPDTMLVFIDAYDVIINNTLDHLKQCYAETAKPGQILIQKDLKCYPDKRIEPDMRAKFPGRQHPFCNSGFLVGPAASFLRVFKDHPIAGFKDDQYYWAKVLLARDDDLVAIDFDNKCSIGYYFFKDYQWRTLQDGTKSLILPTGEQPAIVHLPGNSKVFLPKWLRTTNRRGVPAAYRYPVLEGFIFLACLAVAVLIAMIVLAVLYAKERRCASSRGAVAVATRRDQEPFQPLGRAPL